MNTTLKGQTGESLGIVQDLIADPTSGQLQFAVLSLSPSAAGAPGTGAATTRSTDPSISSPRAAPSGVGSYGTITGGGQLVAVPWRLLSAGAGDQFSAMVDRAKLESAPRFSAASWPTMDSAWMQKVYSHFGVDATGAGAGAPGAGTGTGRGTINPATPGLPSTPGTPDITPPLNANPSTTPGTPGTAPGTTPGTTPSGAPGTK